MLTSSDIHTYVSKKENDASNGNQKIIVELMNRCFRVGPFIYEHFIQKMSSSIENFFEPQILHRKLNNMKNVVVPTKCNIVQQCLTIHLQLFSNISMACMLDLHTYTKGLLKNEKLQ